MHDLLSNVDDQPLVLQILYYMFAIGFFIWTITGSFRAFFGALSEYIKRRSARLIKNNEDWIKNNPELMFEIEKIADRRIRLQLENQTMRRNLSAQDYMDMFNALEEETKQSIREGIYK